MKNFRFTTTDRTIKFFILFALLLAISSCASMPSTTISRDEIPTLSENKGRIYFYRTSSLFAIRIMPPIFLNDKKVGLSFSGTAFYVDVDPGKYNVSVEKILYSGNERRSIDFEVHENEVVYVRTWIGSSAFFARIANVAVESPDNAKKHIKDLKFLRFYLEEKPLQYYFVR